MNFEQKHLVLGIGVLMVFGAAALTAGMPQGDQDNEEVQVVATFYPFYQISDEVAGENAEVSTLVPPGTDPHSFEPSPNDIQRLKNADIFVVTGAEFERWEADLKETVSDDVKIVEPSERIELLEIEDDHDDHEHGEHHGEEEHHEDEHHEEHEHHENGHEGEHEHHGEEEDHEDERHDEHEHHEEEHGHEHDHGRYDPHYWLSPINAEIIAEDVGDALREVDPENSASYSENEAELISELRTLDADFRNRLSTCEKDRILVTHAAFTYLGNEYGFEQVPITGLGHLTEPTAAELERLQNQADEHGLNYIFYDSMTAPSIAETIAGGVEAEVLVLHSIEGAQERTYIDLMEENLQNLETALECH